MGRYKLLSGTKTKNILFKSGLVAEINRQHLELPQKSITAQEKIHIRGVAPESTKQKLTNEGQNQISLPLNICFIFNILNKKQDATRIESPDPLLERQPCYF